nr:aconitate hydratase 2, mitochondrial [Ziziphus jujuba var. spinosa]
MQHVWKTRLYSSSRQSNHEVMARGTFANIHLPNKLLNGEVGQNMTNILTGDKLCIIDAARVAKEDIVKLKDEAKAYNNHRLQSVAQVNEDALKLMEIARENIKFKALAC